MVYNCALINAECIALGVVGAVNQWEARVDTLEMSQTLLTNKKHGNLDKVHSPNIIKPMQTRINGEK